MTDSGGKERAKSSKKLLANSSTTRKAGKEEAFTSFDQYARLFEALPRPGFIDTWAQDGEFAYQRLGGVNPLSIRRVDTVPGSFAITDERLTGRPSLLVELRTLERYLIAAIGGFGVLAELAEQITAAMTLA